MISQHITHDSGLSLRQMIEKVDSVLEPRTYLKQEIMDDVRVPEHELDATCLSANTLDMNANILCK